jgi:1-acyl-sn-glycerol-3-phosphate acyltransferase
MMMDPAIKDAIKAIVEVMRQPMADPAGLPDFGFDRGFLERTAPALAFLWSRYFRVSLRGLENIPASGAALLVANHSGGLPYDGAMLIHACHSLHPAHRPLRPLVATFAVRSPWMRPVVARIGGVRASMRNALDLCERGHLVGVFPEGLRGIGKLYRERYRLTKFGRGGFVRLARAAQVPIIPIAIVGAEETHPVVAKLVRLAKPFGLPYIPITPTFPILGPLGLLPVPAKWSIQIGKPIPPTVQSGSDILEVAENVRSIVDRMIADLLLERRSVLFG